MVMLINGRWTDAELSVVIGRFVRPESVLPGPLRGRDLCAWRGVAATVDLTAIRDPFGIVAATVDAGWSATRGRGRFGPARVALLSEREVEVAAGTLQPCAGVDAWTG